VKSFAGPQRCWTRARRWSSVRFTRKGTSIRRAATLALGYSSRAMYSRISPQVESQRTSSPYDSGNELPAKTRVLVVLSHPVQYFTPVFRELARAGSIEFTVAYCSMHGVEPGVDPELGVTVAWDVPLLNGYRWTFVENRSPKPAIDTFWGAVNPGLWRLVRSGDFDVVVSYGYRAISNWIAALAARIGNRAKFVWVTDAIYLSSLERARWKEPLKKMLVPRIYRFADGVFALSSRSSTFIHELGVERDRIFLVPYVVDNDFFARGCAAADRNETRSTLGVRDDQLLALYVGKLAPWKRPGDLVRALSHVPNAHLALVGEGEERRRLEQLALQLGVDDRVTFLGFVNQRGLSDVYAAADVVLLASEYEAFGLVVNEAFACGVPAVVSDRCGAAGDLVADGDTGYVVPTGDSTAYADRLRQLASDDELRRTLGAQARKRIGEWGPTQAATAFARGCRSLTLR